MSHFTLHALGWDSRFETQAKSTCDAGCFPARVAIVDRDQLVLIGETGFFRAKLSGKYKYESASPSTRPCVGDWACVEKGPQDESGVVHKILGRKTYLRRRAVGDAIEYQMIAANVDFVIVVQSCHYDFNVRRLERYLVMIKDGGATPLILLTKTDLVTPEALATLIEQVRRAGITEPVVTLSNVTGQGMEDLQGVLLPGKTYCFVGSSGVGKSTIINGLVGRELLETKAVSGTGEGKHTTVRRELMILKNGAMVIDNPGMREFGVVAADSAVAASYSDIVTLASQCHFRDCTHTNEPGCAVLDALARGVIEAQHYDNFVKLRRESEHAQLSYAEKRKKDKAFGRFIKSAKKDYDQE